MPPEDSALDDHIEWKAGLVTEVPHPLPLPIDISEIASSNPDKKNLAMNYTGFRIETMTDVNADRKDEQLQWHYLPVSSLRPFKYYSAYLAGKLRGQWHKSILNALNSLSSFSLALPLKLVGRWPNAWVLYAGIYLGAELLVVGDAVALLPSLKQKKLAVQPNQVLVVTAVILAFRNLEADPPQYNRVTGDTCSAIDIRLHGTLYTVCSSPNDSGSEAMDIEDPTKPELPPTMRDPNTEYKLVAQPGIIHSVPLSRVQGRLHEPAALEAYSLPENAPSLAAVGVLEGRKYSKENDAR